MILNLVSSLNENTDVSLKLVNDVLSETDLWVIVNCSELHVFLKVWWFWTTWVLGHIFIFILFIICQFYTA